MARSQGSNMVAAQDEMGAKPAKIKLPTAKLMSY